MNTTMRMKAIPYRNQPTVKEGVLFEEVVTVKRILMTSATILMFALMALGVSTARGSAPTGWYSSFESASRQSQRTGKPLFVLLARTGCHACEEMEANLRSSAARHALNNAVKVRCETSENPALTARYAAGGTPTTVIFAAGNYQNPIYTYTGTMDINTIQQVGRSMESLN